VDITGDETWIQGYDPKTSHHFTQWKFAAPLRLKEERAVASPMCCVDPVDYFVSELIELCTGGLSERNTFIRHNFRQKFRAEMAQCSGVPLHDDYPT
jgi:hypothetical protein